MGKRKAASSSGTPTTPQPSDSRYQLGRWAEGEGIDLTNHSKWQSEVGPRLGQDISAGKSYNLKTGHKVNDVAVPDVKEPRYHIDLKVQESDPIPKTTLNAGNAWLKSG